MSIKVNKSLMLREIKKSLGIAKDSEFARLLGIKPQTLSTWYSRNTFDLPLIYSKCRHLSAHWLLTGEGNMLQQSERQSVDVEGPEINLARDFDERIICKTGIPKISSDTSLNLSENDLPPGDQAADQYLVKEFKEAKADFIIRINGESMYPNYKPGDLVACRRVAMDRFFQWHKVYILDTSQGALLKRIHRSKNKGYITCISDNPEYPPYDVNLALDVYMMAIVVGSIRME